MPTSEGANVVKATPVTIRVNWDAEPVASACRRQPFSVRDEISKELDRLCAADSIEPVKEATPWVSPIVPARKANGKLRLCIDYRNLNKHVVRERYEIPTMDEITAQIHGPAVFSVLDAESGFHQLALDVGSRPLTTFTTHKGLYRFKCLPFGISTATETFQHVLSDLLDGIERVFVYIDILIVGKDQEEHDQRFHLVLDRLTAVNLWLNWTKSQVRQASVRYLGGLFDAAGLHHDPEKAAAIGDMPPPSSLKTCSECLACLLTLDASFLT